MVEWRDKGILLKARPYGEAAWVAHFLTQDHGRCAGLIRGGTTTRRQLQPGNNCDLHWSSRLEDQLGLYRVEVDYSVAPRVLDDPLRLHGLIATLDLIDKTLPEREMAAGLYAAMSVWTQLLETDVWGETLVKVELGLLEHLGYGLDLTKCAVSGVTSDLTFVSPRSGSAVCSSVAKPYKGKLLPLPRFLGSGEDDETPDEATSQTDEVIKGLNLTGYFLHHRVFAVTNTALPESRQKLPDKLHQLGELA